MSKKLNTLFSGGAVLAMLLFSSTPSAMAVNYMWNNTGTTWNGTSSWVGGVAPTSNSSATTDTVEFGSMTANFNTVYLASNRTVAGATFDAGANAYTFTTDAVAPLRLAIGTSGIANNSTATQTFNLGVDLTSGNGTWQSVAGGSMLFNNGIGLNTGTSVSNRNLTVAGAGNFTVNQAIANGGLSTAGLVTVTATGTTTFSGNNTYGGLTTMNAASGTLTLSGNNSGAAGGVTLIAGTLNINNNNALGSGALSLAGAGATINNTSGSAVVNAGNQTWSWTDGLAFGATGNTAANNLNLGTGVVTASSSRTIALAGSDTKLTIGAVNITSVSTGRTITANGVGNTLIMGGLTLSGNTTNAVTVTLAGTANIGVTGAIVNGQSFANGVTVTSTGTTTLSGNNTYTGLITMNAAGGTLTLSGNNSAASGGVTVTTGNLNVNSANALGSGTFTLTAGTINNTSGVAVVNAGNNAVTLGSILTYGTAGGTASNNLDLGTGTVAVSADRTLTLLGTGTTLKMGTLESTATSGGKDFTFNGTGNTMFFRGFNISTGTSTAVTNNLVGSASLTISGPIANGNLLANGVNIKGTGTTTFSGANTYTGGTEVFSGSTLLYGADNVTADAGGQMGVSGTLNIASYNDTVSSVKVNAGGLLSGTTGVLTAGSFNLLGANTVSAILGGSSATLDKGTQGTVTLLSGANTYGGLTTVGGGTLKLGNSSALGTTVGATTVGTGGFLDLNGQTGVAEKLNYTGTGGLINSAAGTTASVSGAVDIGVGMTVETAGDITLSGQLTGSLSKNLTKSGAGTLKVTASNSTFTGTNTVSAGTLLVDTGASVASSTSIVNGGLLKVNGTAGGVTVNLGGSLGGTGTVGAVTLKTGSYLKPGNSPGLLTASASSSWAAGSYYNWEINDATGTAGTNWDVFYVAGASGALDLSALSASTQMNLVLESLSIANYSTSTSYSWVIAKAAIFTGIADGTQDLTNYFNINTVAFNGGSAANLPNGGFQVVTGTEGSLRTLNLMAIPEPSTGTLLGFGLGGLVLTRLLRRKQI